MPTELRPFYFTVVFWGGRHRGYFLDLLLRSLLAPGNIPALKRARGSKFLIAAPRADWDALQNEPIFARLRDFVEPIWLDLGLSALGESKMRTMSRGQELLAARTFRDRAYGVFLTPDTMLSDGSVAALERCVEEGAKVVLVVAIRFAHEKLVAALEHGGYMDRERTLAVGARELMRLALSNLHTETLTYEFDTPWFANQPVSVWWRVPDGDGIVIHSFSWAPLAVDYAALDDHDTSTFKEWTLDGDYIWRNFPDPADVHVVTDSDEIALVSFTPEAELHFDLMPDWRKSVPWFSRAYKIELLRILRNGPVMDPLKRSIFPRPVYLHAGPIGPEWQRHERIAQRVIRSARGSPGLLERYQLEVLKSGYGGEPGFGAWFVGQARFVQSFAVPAFRYLGFAIWLMVALPRRWARRHIGALIWTWRFRRFVWWRLKGRVGLGAGGRDWREPGWDAPALGLMNPLFSLRWLWQNRRSPGVAVRALRGHPSRPEHN